LLIAVDDKHIPLGSVLLAELPVLDNHGKPLAMCPVLR
jgi:membrane-bound lytic murein transglycosylase